MIVLVYQNGIANVFRVDGGVDAALDNTAPRKRLLQHAYTCCEWFARGMVAAGESLAVAYCDHAGDVILQTWNEGAGPLFRESKEPPKKA